MNAAVVNIPGQAPKYQSFPDPAPDANEDLVRVRAAGLHPLVKSTASGAHYSSSTEQKPAIPGVDGVGVLDDGRRVYFVFVRKPWGTMAEFAAAPRANCIPVPDDLDDVTAAAIANPGMPAWLSMKNRAALAPGETVLIMGATGVSGQLAIQVARHLGAGRIIAAGRNIDAISSTDVDAIISLAQPEDAIREALTSEAASGIDVIVDYLWGRPTELVLEALARRLPGSTPRAKHAPRRDRLRCRTNHHAAFGNPAQRRPKHHGQRIRRCFARNHPCRHSWNIFAGRRRNAEDSFRRARPPGKRRGRLESGGKGPPDRF